MGVVYVLVTVGLCLSGVLGKPDGGESLDGSQRLARPDLGKDQLHGGLQGSYPHVAMTGQMGPSPNGMLHARHPMLQGGQGRMQGMSPMGHRMPGMTQEGKQMNGMPQMGQHMSRMPQMGQGMHQMGQRMPGMPQSGQQMHGMPQMGQHMPGMPQMGQQMHGMPQMGQHMSGMPQMGQQMHGMPQMGQHMPGIPQMGHQMSGMPQMNQQIPGMPQMGQPTENDQADSNTSDTDNLQPSPQSQPSSQPDPDSNEDMPNLPQQQMMRLRQLQYIQMMQRQRQMMMMAQLARRAQMAQAGQGSPQPYLTQAAQSQEASTLIQQSPYYGHQQIPSQDQEDDSSSDQVSVQGQASGAWAQPQYPGATEAGAAQMGPAQGRMMALMMLAAARARQQAAAGNQPGMEGMHAQMGAPSQMGTNPYANGPVQMDSHSQMQMDPQTIMRLRMAQMARLRQLAQQRAQLAGGSPDTASSDSESADQLGGGQEDYSSQPGMSSVGAVPSPVNLPFHDIQGLMRMEVNLQHVRMQLLKSFYSDLMIYRQMTEQIQQRMVAKLALIHAVEVKMAMPMRGTVAMGISPPQYSQVNQDHFQPANQDYSQSAGQAVYHLN